MSQALLETNAVTRRFGGLTAVDQVTLQVAAGSLHGLIGPNGAGKTTLVNMMTGLERVDGGQVSFRGEDVTGVPSHRMARRGMARSFQTSQLFEEEDVISNVMAGRHQHVVYRFPHTFFYTPRTARVEQENRDRCMALLEELRIVEYAQTRVSELPYGRRRLVELARAVATEPNLLVLDEPAAGLSGTDVTVLEELLVRLTKSGYTIFVIEHNIALLMNICERITVIAEGQIIADGTPAEVRSDPVVIEAYLGRSGA